VNGLGAVSVDIHKKEREYEHLTLSDENVVKYLLQFRSIVDTSYGASININMNQAGDTFEFNQELVSLYASLDKIIDKIELKEKDEEFLKLMFEGYSISRIIDDFGFPRKTAYRTMDRIVDKIVDANDSEWKRVMEINGFVIEGDRK
jgi:ribosome-associated translation inhibitor RaiA